MATGAFALGCLIYGLVDPRDGRLRYVGKTSGSLERRRRAHLNDVRRGRVYIPRHKWMNDLLSLGLEPEGVEIEVDVADWREAEQFWIAYLRGIGCALLNATAGGDGLGGYKHRQETKAKQAAAARRRYQRPGERERTSAAVKAGKARPDAKASTGRIVSAATREKLAAATKIYQNTPTAKAALSARLAGVPKSAEHRAKISAAKIGRPRTADSVAKQVATMTGRHHSPETRAKIAAAARARYAAA